MFCLPLPSKVVLDSFSFFISRSVCVESSFDILGGDVHSFDSGFHPFVGFVWSSTGMAFLILDSNTSLLLLLDCFWCSTEDSLSSAGDLVLLLAGD